jgi:hypothetical protein
MVRSWVERFGGDLGVDIAPFLVAGVCRIQLEGEAELTFELRGDGEAVFVHAPVAPVPGGLAQGLFLEALLMQNHVDADETGCALAFDAVGGEAVLQMVLSAADGLDYEAFVAHVRRFLGRLTSVRTDLRAMERPEKGADDMPPDMEDPLLLHMRYLRA